MGTADRVDLEGEIDDAFQRRERRVQRVGWLAMGLIILAALLGLTGGGPLARRHSSEAGADLRWERFARAEARTEIRLEAPAALFRGDTLTVRVARPSFDEFKVEEIRPTPAQASVGDAYVEYRFAVPRGARSTAILLALRPEKIGRHELTITAANVPPFVVRQLVLP